MKNKPQGGRGRRAFRRFLALFAALGILLTLIFMFFTAMTVHLKRATVHLPDLPAAFVGTRLLYLSDFHLHGLNNMAAAQDLLAQLRDVPADVVLLGGNYSNDAGQSLDELFALLTQLPNSEGIYAIAGENDDTEALQRACASHGITLLNNSGVSLQREGASLFLVGFSPNPGDLNAAAAHVRGGQCVIALVNDPEWVPRLNTTEAADGGPWIDLCLCGHNLGGQMRVAGRTLLTLSENQRRYLSGWILDSMPILISQGLGCKGVNLRLNTQAEAWLITLEQS